MLRTIAGDRQKNTKELLGEAAFYGPKVDFLAIDSIGRQWQLATIQLDMMMPERFNLTCTNENGEKERIVMIHAAIMGSLERFLSVYIEHVGGNFPLWLAPTQIAVLPIAETHNEYAIEVTAALDEVGIRASLLKENETLGKKIKNVKESKIPYFVVLGDAEVKNKTVTLETRDGKEKEELSVEGLVTKLSDENKAR